MTKRRKKGRGRLPASKGGKCVRNLPSAFPLYAARKQSRIVTADIWAFFRNSASSILPMEVERKAIAFIDQAYEFFEAAKTPRFGSRPLLYYYSFLNIVKAYLLMKKVNLPVSVRHGISDPRENKRERRRLQGQSILIQELAQDHSRIFPEFLKCFNMILTKEMKLRVLDLLKQVPTIHRTYCRVTKDKPVFLPVKSFQALSKNREIHIRLILDRNQKDTKQVLGILQKRRAFSLLFTQVASCSKEASQNRNTNEEISELWYETNSMPGHRRGRSGIKAMVE
jgi:hypothetical protein